MADQTTQIMLKLDARSEADTEQLAELTRQLREELWELDVDAVDLVPAGETPERAKSVDLIALGNLMVTLVTSGAALAALISTLQGWLEPHQRRNCSVTLEIDGDRLEVTGISSEEQQVLINAWLDRHRTL